MKVKFDNVTLEKATNLIMGWLDEKKQRYVTTPNPEILLEAEKNHKFRKVLNNANLNIADGTGILWAAKHLDSTKDSKSKLKKIGNWFYSLALVPFRPEYRKSVLPERVTGVDLMEQICDKTQKTGHAIYLLGAKKGVAEKTKKTLEAKYPQVNIIGTYSGSPSLEEENEIIDRINKLMPEVLFVAYGAPDQEMWISRNLKKLNGTRVAMGIGGAFDFIAGERKRAPKWMRKTGLEWIYRVIQQPSRIGRIFNATIKFPWKILKRNLK